MKWEIHCIVFLATLLLVDNSKAKSTYHYNNHPEVASNYNDHVQNNAYQRTIRSSAFTTSNRLNKNKKSSEGEENGHDGENSQKDDLMTAAFSNVDHSFGPILNNLFSGFQNSNGNTKDFFSFSVGNGKNNVFSSPYSAPKGNYENLNSQYKTIYVTMTKEVPVPYPVHIEKKIPHFIKVPVDKPVPITVNKPFPVHIEKPVPYPVKVNVPQPYPVTIERHVPYPVRIPVDKPFPVHVPKPYPVFVEKEVPVQVDKPIPYPVRVPVDRPYLVHVPITKHVPIHIERKVPFPIEVPVDKPFPIPVPEPYPVTVEKPVPYAVDKPIPYPVKIPIRVPVQVPYPVPVHIPTQPSREQESYEYVSGIGPSATGSGSASYGFNRNSASMSDFSSNFQNSGVAEMATNAESMK